MIEYNKKKADAKIRSVRTRPRVYMSPQISLDELTDEYREVMCDDMYTSSKTIGELTSGILQTRPISVNDQEPSSKPSADLVK
jgi:hypothetical protein